MLDVRRVDPTDLAVSQPRPAGRLNVRYRWIGRLPGDERVKVDAVMVPHARKVPARLAAGCRTVALMIDQTRAAERHRVVMAAARVGGRALPLAWRIEETAGAVGLAEQRKGLEAAARLPPAGAARLVATGGGFPGAPDLIALGRGRGWGGGREWGG